MVWHQILLGTVLCLTPVTSAADWHHPLALNGGDYWRVRLPVVIENDGDVALSGEAARLSIEPAGAAAALVGKAAHQIRVVGSEGNEVLFAIYGPDGEPLRSGPILAGSSLVLPVDCQAKSSATYQVYFDNPAAGNVPDFLKARPDDRRLKTVRIRTLGLERKELTELGGTAGWSSESADRRARVAVFNFGEEPSADGAMVSVDLEMIRRRARGRLDPDSLQVKLAGRTIPYVRLGHSLLLRGDLPPRTAVYYSVYFDDNAELGAVADEHPAALAGLPNLVRNGQFDQGGTEPLGWLPTGALAGTDGVRMFVDKQQRNGSLQACVRMDVPDGLPHSWRGWRQSVPVRPGGTYLLAAWLKCEGLGEGRLQVHAHRRTANGRLSHTDPMTSILQGISGTTDWTLVSGTFTMPDDTTELELHLTTTAAGTVWHDGVVMTEVLPGRIAQFECRPLDAATAPAVWAVPSVVKVFTDDPAPSTAENGQIAAAKNEQEVLQLAVRSGSAIDGIHVRAEPPRNSGGATLPTPEVNLVGYVPIDYPTAYYVSRSPAWHRLMPTTTSQCDGWPGLWPDPLLPTNMFDLKANTTQAIWITVTVPDDAAAGQYAGKVRFESGSQLVAVKDYTVRVWDFTLPAENHVAAIYDIRYGPGGTKQWGGKSLDSNYPELLRFLADRRLSADTIRPMPKIRYVNGRVEADFTEWDKAAAVFFDELKLPYAYTPWTFYLFGWGHPPKTMFGETPFEGEPPFEGADRSRLRAEYKEAYQACLGVFWSHVKQKGWADRIVLYISDEPHDRHPLIRTQMRTLCDMIHEVDPAIPVYSSTWKHVPEWDGYLDVWGLGHDGRVASEKMAELRAAGDRIWFTTDGQMCTDTPYCAIERLLPHYCFRYGVQAYEFWGASWLTYDPFLYGWHSYIRQSSEPGEYYWIRYPNGDGFLIYPGAPLGHAGPVSSIRLENAREGVEDYEYLYRLKSLIAQAKAAGRDASDAEKALAAAAELVEIPNVGGRFSSKILPEPEKLEKVRIQIAEAIESRE